ncbi:hypothetical protein DYBT9275_06082 [Dyadobacter sp. CECT 9275]|uniref:T9SS type A sorting domain-containing protein n=1 Tax=Dyadobacter helix TaxID=2822344 RepID=A0A916NET7_9BACT|nr:hypothetical protein [Dyadobacter sp. CECT 9275]CAG5018841.1 hypothetical protein DYBT9275_06082 [Dyadobacter sp. CECT 9275]
MKRKISTLFFFLIPCLALTIYPSFAQKSLQGEKVQTNQVKAHFKNGSFAKGDKAVRLGIEQWLASQGVRQTAGAEFTAKELGLMFADPSKMTSASRFTKPGKGKTGHMGGLKDASAGKNTKIAARRIPRLRPSSFTTRRAGSDVPTTLYVNWAVADPLGDGSSWDQAYPELADALIFARDNPSVEQIWVANGVYLPAYPADYEVGDDWDYQNRNNVFVLPANVKVYGGFAGTEATLAERVFKVADQFIIMGGSQMVSSTILCGDVNGDDFYYLYQDDPTAIEDNCYHVVVAAGTSGAVLDGFTIYGGNADATGDLTIGAHTIPGTAGGGIAVVNATPALSNLIVRENFASTGSAIYGEGASFTLTNTVIAGNVSSEKGGVSLVSSAPVFTNVTIAGNSAVENAGGIYCTGNSSLPIIRNTIVYGNTAPADPNILLADDASPSFEYSIIQGSRGSGNGTWDSSFGEDGGNNIDADPKFQDPEYGLFGLQPSSPGVNGGNDLYFQASQSPDLSGITTDLRGITRITGAHVEIGALESLYDNLTTTLVHTGGRLYVKQGGAGNGSSWGNAAREVADALLAARLNADITEIWVAGGTYYPLYRPDNLAADPDRRNHAFVLVDGVKIYGGFAGNEGSLSDRILGATPSILSGDFNNDDIALSNIDLEDFLQNGPSTTLDENALQLIYAADLFSENTVFDGFTVQGAALLSRMQEFNIEDEDAGEFFGKFFTDYLLVNEIAAPRILGSGFVSLGSDVEISNVTVRNNFGILGGSVFTFGSLNRIYNSVVYNNFSLMMGGGITCFSTFSDVINATVTKNLSFGAPAGMIDFDGRSFVSNSIFYGSILNEELLGPEFSSISLSFPFDSQIDHSIIGGSGGSSNWSLPDPVLDGGGNLDEDPLFANAATDDFTPTACSAAVNAGVNNFINPDSEENLDLTALLPQDLAGNDRVFNTVIDMGSFEFQGSTPPGVLPLAGNGKESEHEFTSNTAHSFTAGSGLCTVDLLQLEPTEGLSGNVMTKVWVDPSVRTYNNAVYLQRHYDIEPETNAGSAKGKVTLYFTQAEFDAFNLQVEPEEYLPTGTEEGEGDRKANFRIYQFHGVDAGGYGDPSSYDGDRTEIDPGVNNIVWDSDKARWEVTFTVNGFSGFFAGTASHSPLPVRLVSFNGKLTEQQKVQLDWKVTEQVNIDTYIVEYSATGKSFTEIGRKVANTVASTNYTYLDTLSHAGGTAYYRLKIVELDGTKAYSRLISVKLPEAPKMIAYPVPAKNELWIDWKKSDADKAEFFDKNGRLLHTVGKTKGVQRVDISRFPSGLLLLKAGNDTRKILKE